MHEATSSPRRSPLFLTASLARELGILLTLSVLFPFMIHVLPVPDDARLGARLLPIFYAPLLAVLLGRTSTAWLVALLAPWLNWIVTAHPRPLGAATLTIELMVFVLVLRTLYAGTRQRWFMAIPAYLSGLMMAASVAAFFPAIIDGRAAWPWAVHSVLLGLPGIGVLMLITLFAHRCYPPGTGGGGPISA